MDITRPREIGILDDAVCQIDDRPGLLVGKILVLDILADAKFGSELLDDVGKLGLDLLAPVELLADFLLPAQKTEDLLAGHFVNLRRHRYLKRIREGHQQVFAHLAHREREILLAEVLRNTLERGRPHLVALHVVWRQPVSARPRHEQLEIGDPIFVLQELVECGAGEISGGGKNSLLLRRRKTVHLLKLGDNLLLDFAECHGDQAPFATGAG